MTGTCGRFEEVRLGEKRGDCPPFFRNAKRSQVITVDKRDLVERIGAVYGNRVREILDGVRLLLEPRD